MESERFNVSVVIHDHVGLYLRDTLQIIAQSNYVDIIYVLFNGRARESELGFAVCDKFQYIRTQNDGFGAAHNIAMDLSRLQRSNHIILNPDIQIASEEFDAFCSWFIHCKGCGVAGPKVHDENGFVSWSAYTEISFTAAMIRRLSKHLYLKSAHGEQTEIINSSQIPLSVSLLSGCFLIIRLAILEKHQFDQRYFLYYEDYDFCMSVSRGGELDVVYCPQFHVTHSAQRASSKNIGLFFVHVMSHLKYFRKWSRK
jgi:GT2 family glycosyltransferase